MLTEFKPKLKNKYAFEENSDRDQNTSEENQFQPSVKVQSPSIGRDQSIIYIGEKVYFKDITK